MNGVAEPLRNGSLSPEGSRGPPPLAYGDPPLWSSRPCSSRRGGTVFLMPRPEAGAGTGAGDRSSAAGAAELRRGAGGLPRGPELDEQARCCGPAQGAAGCGWG